MLTDLKEKVWKANLDLVKYDLVTLTWGNVSGINHEKGLLAIKPSGMSYRAMKLEDIVIVDLSGKVIIERFARLKPLEMPAVLVAGHSSFSWGKSPDEAVKNSLILEKVAKIAWGTLCLNPECNNFPDYLLNKHYQRKHGPKAYYGQKK